MRVYLVLIAIIGLFLLAGACSAAPTIPDETSTIFSNANWTVVNHQSIITITAKNASFPIPNATVSVLLTPTTLGSLVMASTTTDASGQVTGTFTAGTKSGAVNITATITNASYSVQKTVTQYIDHDSAYSAQFDYDSEVTVDTETPFVTSLTDRWGNPFDNKNPFDYHPVSFYIGSVTGAGAFDDGGVYRQNLNVMPDANGTISLIVKTDIVSGENIISMKSIGAISDQYKSIVGMTDAVPSRITAVVTPDDPASQPCDGEADHIFTFVYTLYDKHGNIAKNQSLLLHTSWSEETDTTFTTNDYGQIWLTYGPHETAGNISVTATSITNTSVTDTHYVEFYSTDPVNMVLMASPQTMGSLDSGSSIRANLSAEVIDTKGNPVHNETVTFSIGTPVYDGTYNITAGPELTSTSAVTDSDGFAIVQFKPGAFSRNATDIDYTQTATGHVTVTATWGTVKRTVQLTWKNYPYLSADTAVSPITIALNGTVDLTIKLKGDGWALQPNPIDVDLVLDRSGSMGYDIAGNDPPKSSTRLSIAKTAATNFVGNMTPGQDRVGLFSYSSTVTHNAALQTPFGPVTSAISGLSATGATITRDATKQAIDDMIAHKNTNTKAVRAVIVMTDGDWNYEGSPAAHGTGWPTGSSGYTFSGNTLEPDNYRYYSDLGGTLVQPTPIAYFTASAGSSTKYKVTFIDGSANSPTSFIWNFGDGGTSTSQSPSHTYTTTGTYTVTETVTSTYGSSTLTRTATVGWSSYNSRSTVSLSPSMSAPTNTYATCTNGEFTTQNLSIYAKNNNIRLYFIFFAGTPNPTSKTTLQTMANATGGFYQQATTAADLNDAYKKIAGDLQTAAGVNTSMQVVFNNVNVSGVTFPGAEVYSYVYNPSTTSGSTRITWQDGNTNVTDQTADWNADHNLNFTIGTITLGQTWQADMLFNITKAGNVEAFGNSSLCFNNGADCLFLPVKYINVIPNLTNSGLSMGGIQITDLHPTQTKNITDFLPLTWNLTYPGNITRSATEDIYYSTDNNQWTHFDTKSSGPCNQSPQYSNLDVRDLPAGTYFIRVLAKAEDATGDEKITETGIQIGMAGKSYIKLE